MPIPLTCPHCGHQENVEERNAGQTGACASCGKTITLPLGSGAKAAAAPRRNPLSCVGCYLILVTSIIIIDCVGMLLARFLPAVQARREAVRRSRCSTNFQQIGRAMHNYHATYKSFPPAVITDEDGRPMRSWRVAILPFIEYASLYDQYDLSEPWDGPNNRELRDESISAYRCPSDAASMPWITSYVMVAGPGTIGGEPNETVGVADVQDGTSNTILAIEVGASGIHWMEPRDVTVDEAVIFLANPPVSPFQQVHPGGANVLFADGSVHFLPDSTDPAIVRSLLIRDDGQAIPPDS